MEKAIQLITIKKLDGDISHALVSDRAKRGKYQKLFLPVPTKYDYQRKEARRYLWGYRIVDTRIKEKDIKTLDYSRLIPCEDNGDIVIKGKHFNLPPRIVNPCTLKPCDSKGDVYLAYCNVVYQYKLPEGHKLIPFNEKK